MQRAPAKEPSRFRQAVGAGLVVVSAICVAIVPSFAKFAFEGGSNTLSIITGRSIVSVLMTILLVIALRQPLAIARQPLLISLAMGVDYAALLYGYLGAVQYLPVSLVILIYFIHPLLVGFFLMFLGEERLTWLSIGALAAALAGLALAIGFNAGELNFTGLCLAAFAMVAAAIYIVGNARAVRGASALTVAFYVMLSAAAALTALFILFGTLALPTTTLSWMGFVGVAIAATAGTLTFISGMAYVGAARAAMVSNLEPVLGVLFAMTVLGEEVTSLQGAGIALVLASIVTMELRR
jgi:drug/metabolite transporter (DMT)-like permease